MGNIIKEKRTVAYMIALYCRKKHGQHTELCPECQQLKEYAHLRLDKCQFGDNKPACKRCTVHCYKKDMRAQIRKVMRFSGPRMLIYYPLDFLKHHFQLKSSLHF